VPTYHEWMKDEVCLYPHISAFYSLYTPSLSVFQSCIPHLHLSLPTNRKRKSKHIQTKNQKELQELTASEPLSLPEEYDMQRSWRQDLDKLTFIACLPPSSTPTTITPKQDDAPSQMLGDINLFLVDDDDDEETPSTTSTAILGEIELMIAVKSQHRKGHGRASLLAFLHYILSNTTAILDEYAKGKEAYLRYLRVKISAENVKSIALFESVGFVRTSAEANYFGELELRLQVQGNEKVLVDLEKVKGWSGAPSVVEYREV
jgi:RimJ/RimL family protein N-acetyltransferase